MLKITACSLLLLFSFIMQSQPDSNLVISFNFNDHKIIEDHNLLSIKPVGVTLTEDRFGNKNSAVYLHGNSSSYINLGSSDLLKLKKGTLSIWVNIQAVVFAGKGYPINALLISRSTAEEDFNIAFGVGYSIPNHRFGAQSSKDSIHEATVFSKDPVLLDQWYHVLVTIDNSHLALYVNGELQERINKDFETRFLAGDSILIGKSMGYKNIRYSNAIIDDLRFYHRVLKKDEIINLYQELDPNRLKHMLLETFKYIIIIVLLVLVIILLLIRNKRTLKKQKDFYELNNKVKELEIKVIKSQMNPHFISNSLAAIQNLIYKKEIEKAAQYLAKFSFFLRQVLDYSDKMYITLDEEINLAKLNIELEQLRFNENFSFELSIEEGLDIAHILIPSLIMQPFIENAIWHGLLPLHERDPKLNIKVYLENNTVFINIEDNGVGRSPVEKTDKNPHGTKLVLDKIESINRLSQSSYYKLEIADLKDENGTPAGTKIIIRLSNSNNEE